MEATPHTAIGCRCTLYPVDQTCTESNGIFRFCSCDAEIAEIRKSWNQYRKVVRWLSAVRVCDAIRVASSSNS
jgi:hypothetical protein